MLPAHRQPACLHLLLLVSGASGLGCQIVWTRQLAGGLGQEVPAVLAVVAAFFAGLALGAGWLDRRITESRHPAHWYGGLEMVIGIWTAATAWLIPWLNAGLSAWIGLAPAAARHWSIAFVMPLLALLPATAAMGATLPAMVRFAGSIAPDRNRVGSLYAANTLGAVGGTLLGALWLIPQFGFRHALLILAGASFSCGLAALAVARLASTTLPAAGAGSPAHAAMRGGPSPVLLAGTGLLGIGYEVLAVRLLAEVLEDTVLTFAAVLSVYLLGTAVGAAAERRVLPRLLIEDKLRWLLAGLAAACASGAIALRAVPNLCDGFCRLLGHHPAGLLVAEGLSAAIVLALPTFFMGAVFAALAETQRQSNGRVGRAVAWNTLGATIAPLLFGVVLFPVVGGRWTFAVLVAGYGTLLATMRGTGRSQRTGPTLAVLTVATVAAACFAAESQSLLRLLPGERVRQLCSGIAATAAVLETPDRHRALRVDNRFTMGGTGSANAERRHSHLPLLLHDAPRRALFLGVGTGISYGAMRLHPGLSANGVELSPEVATVMGEFDAESGRPTWGQDLTLHLADARRFIRAATSRYDVIVADLFHPARDGAGGLYTREHFAALRDRLAPGGLVVQWLPLYQLDRETFGLIVRTFLAVFPSAQAWLLRPNLDTPVVGLIGSEAPRRYPSDWLDTRATDPQLRAALRPLALTETIHLLGGFLANAASLARFASEGPLNTDDCPLLTFLAARTRPMSGSAGKTLLLQLIEHSGTGLAPLVAETADAAEFRERLRNYVAARDDYLRGLVAEDDGHRALALDLFMASTRRSPDFTTGYARVLTLALREATTNPPAAMALLEQLAAARPEQPTARRLLDEMARRADRSAPLPDGTDH